MEHASSWVVVRVAAEEVGVSESKLRAAYRRGDLQVRDDLVRGRVCKLVQLDEVKMWAGVPVAAVDEEDDPTRLLVGKLEHIATQVGQALDRAGRAEQQVVFLRNELAQLREAHGRVREIVDERSLGAFRATTAAVATTALASPRRRRFLGLTWRVSA
jgi:hypothetical protein